VNREDWNAELESRPLTRAQLGRLQEEARRLGLNRTDRLTVVAVLLGLDNLASFTELRQGHAGAAVHLLAGCPSRAELDAFLPSPPAQAVAPQCAAETTVPERVCAWCQGPIPARARRDSVCCSQRCRQARHRFTRAAGRAGLASGPPRRLAYADPPYPGRAGLYRGHPDYAGEVDHQDLITRLGAYDGWALSTSAEALPGVLALCPAGVRVAAWCRGTRPVASWEPVSAWEPVIYRPARPVDPAGGVRADVLVHGVSAMTTLPGRVTGTKPAVFCRWLFGLLGATAADSLDDLFPGSGAVGRAWAAFTGQDPSRAAGADASPAAGCDASAVAPHDASPPAGNDASLTPLAARIRPQTAERDHNGDHDHDRRGVPELRS
jgi:hypothetical protein